MGAARKFLFTMTTGRSGTLYLAELLHRNFPDAECHHELVGWDRFGVDTPDLSHMTLFNSQGNVAPVRNFWRQKLARIAASPAPFYAETSHLLMKAGLIENLDLLEPAGDIHLVALERDVLATMLSLITRFDFASSGNEWIWYLDPRYPRNLIGAEEAIVGGVENVCLWYIAEIRARAAYYERLLAGRSRVRIHHVTLEELQSEAGAARLFCLLGFDKRPKDVVLPERQNAATRRFVLDGPTEAGLRALIASNPIDAGALADAAIRSGLHF
jgi:hypothetical protein